MILLVSLISRLVACSARIVVDRQTDTQTHSVTLAAPCAPRVNHVCLFTQHLFNDSSREQEIFKHNKLDAVMFRMTFRQEMSNGVRFLSKIILFIRTELPVCAVCCFEHRLFCSYKHY